MTADSGSTEPPYSRLFLPALITASFAVGPITVLASLLLIDIGGTFGTSVGVTGQINTSYSIAAVVFALLAGVLSIRFKHKSLLLVGISLEAISAGGCFLASDFVSLLAFYTLSGAGYAIVNPMAFALIGEHFPLKRRASAVGWVVAGGALVYVIGAPVIALMSGINGWRFPIVAFVIPVLLLSLIMAFLGLPSSPRTRNIQKDAKIRASLNQIFLNKSAFACLVGDALRSAAFVAALFYATSFFRERFLAPTDVASLILLVAALSYVFGSLSGGQFVNRMGRKPATALTALLAGIFTMLYAVVPIMAVSLVLLLTASWFFGMVASSANSLTLEQIPELRGTMMSLDTAVINAGYALGSAAGGVALLYFSYEGLGAVLGSIGVVAAATFSLFAKDPTSSQLDNRTV